MVRSSSIPPREPLLLPTSSSPRQRSTTTTSQPAWANKARRTEDYDDNHNGRRLNAAAVSKPPPPRRRQQPQQQQQQQQLMQWKRPSAIHQDSRRQQQQQDHHHHQQQQEIKQQQQPQPFRPWRTHTERHNVPPADDREGPPPPPPHISMESQDSYLAESAAKNLVRELQSRGYDPTTGGRLLLRDTMSDENDDEDENENNNDGTTGAGGRRNPPNDRYLTSPSRDKWHAAAMAAMPAAAPPREDARDEWESGWSEDEDEYTTGRSGVVEDDTYDANNDATYRYEGRRQRQLQQHQPRGAAATVIPAAARSFAIIDNDTSTGEYTPYELSTRGGSATLSSGSGRSRESDSLVEYAPSHNAKRGGGGYNNSKVYLGRGNNPDWSYETDDPINRRAVERVATELSMEPTEYSESTRPTTPPQQHRRRHTGTTTNRPSSKNVYSHATTARQHRAAPPPPAAAETMMYNRQTQQHRQSHNVHDRPRQERRNQGHNAVTGANRIARSPATSCNNEKASNRTQGSSGGHPIVTKKRDAMAKYPSRHHQTADVSHGSGGGSHLTDISDGEVVRLGDRSTGTYQNYGRDGANDPPGDCTDDGTDTLSKVTGLHKTESFLTFDTQGRKVISGNYTAAAPKQHVEQKQVEKNSTHASRLSSRALWTDHRDEQFKQHQKTHQQQDYAFVGNSTAAAMGRTSGHHEKEAGGRNRRRENKSLSSTATQQFMNGRRVANGAPRRIKSTSSPYRSHNMAGLLSQPFYRRYRRHFVPTKDEGLDAASHPSTSMKGGNPLFPSVPRDGSVEEFPIPIHLEQVLTNAEEGIEEKSNVESNKQNTETARFRFDEQASDETFLDSGNVGIDPPSAFLPPRAIQISKDFPHTSTLRLPHQHSSFIPPQFITPEVGEDIPDHIQIQYMERMSKDIRRPPDKSTRISISSITPTGKDLIFVPQDSSPTTLPCPGMLHATDCQTPHTELTTTRKTRFLRRKKQKTQPEVIAPVAEEFELQLPHPFRRNNEKKLRFLNRLLGKSKEKEHDLAICPEAIHDSSVPEERTKSTFELVSRAKLFSQGWRPQAHHPSAGITHFGHVVGTADGVNCSSRLSNESEWDILSRESECLSEGGSRSTSSRREHLSNLEESSVTGRDDFAAPSGLVRNGAHVPTEDSAENQGQENFEKLASIGSSTSTKTFNATEFYSLPGRKTNSPVELVRTDDSSSPTKTFNATESYALPDRKTNSSVELVRADDSSAPTKTFNVTESYSLPGRKTNSSVELVRTGDVSSVKQPPEYNSKEQMAHKSSQTSNTPLAPALISLGGDCNDIASMKEENSLQNSVVHNIGIRIGDSQSRASTEASGQSSSQAGGRHLLSSSLSAPDRKTADGNSSNFSAAGAGSDIQSTDAASSIPNESKNLKCQSGSSNPNESENLKCHSESSIPNESENLKCHSGSSIPNESENHKSFDALKGEDVREIKGSSKDDTPRIEEPTEFIETLLMPKVPKPPGNTPSRSEPYSRQIPALNSAEDIPVPSVSFQGLESMLTQEINQSQERDAVITTQQERHLDAPMKPALQENTSKSKGLTKANQQKPSIGKQVGVKENSSSERNEAVQKLLNLSAMNRSLNQKLYMTKALLDSDSRSQETSSGTANDNLSSTTAINTETNTLERKAEIGSQQSGENEELDQLVSAIELKNTSPNVLNSNIAAQILPSCGSDDFAPHEMDHKLGYMSGDRKNVRFSEFLESVREIPAESVSTRSTVDSRKNGKSHKTETKASPTPEEHTMSKKARKTSSTLLAWINRRGNDDRDRRKDFKEIRSPIVDKTVAVTPGNTEGDKKRRKIAHPKAQELSPLRSDCTSEKYSAIQEVEPTIEMPLAAKPLASNAEMRTRQSMNPLRKQPTYNRDNASPLLSPATSDATLLSTMKIEEPSSIPPSPSAMKSMKASTVDDVRDDDGNGIELIARKTKAGKNAILITKTGLNPKYENPRSVSPNQRPKTKRRSEKSTAGSKDTKKDGRRVDRLEKPQVKRGFRFFFLPRLIPGSKDNTIKTQKRGGDDSKMAKVLSSRSRTPPTRRRRGYPSSRARSGSPADTAPTAGGSSTSSVVRSTAPSSTRGNRKTTSSNAMTSAATKSSPKSPARQPPKLPKPQREVTANAWSEPVSSPRFLRVPSNSSSAISSLLRVGGGGGGVDDSSLVDHDAETVTKNDASLFSRESAGDWFTCLLPGLFPPIPKTPSTSGIPTSMTSVATTTPIARTVESTPTAGGGSRSNSNGRRSEHDDDESSGCNGRSAKGDSHPKGGDEEKAPNTLIGQREWQEILDATETLAMKYKETQRQWSRNHAGYVDGDARGDDVSVSKETLREVKRAISKFRQHARLLGVRERELMEAVRDDDRSIPSSKFSREMRRKAMVSASWKPNNDLASQVGAATDKFIEMFDFYFSPNGAFGAHGGGNARAVGENKDNAADDSSSSSM